MEKIIDDVGKIVSASYEIEDGGYLEFTTKHKTFVVTTKFSFVIGQGICGIGIMKNESRDSCKHYDAHCGCNDPRVIYMYLYPFWRWKHGKDIKVSIPTREEAIKWLQEADVPIGWDISKGYRNNGSLTEKQKAFFNLK
ncbi:MAG: hypothetical protein IJG38_02350 [Thermoguttaceae bacterium]|nr:hypothetical protein [Thermoguttaceae bacterium]